MRATKTIDILKSVKQPIRLCKVRAALDRLETDKTMALTLDNVPMSCPKDLVPRKRTNKRVNQTMMLSESGI